MKVSTLKCPQLNCGYEWLPRLVNPKQCPLCKKYLPMTNNKQNNNLGNN